MDFPRPCFVDKVNVPIRLYGFATSASGKSAQVLAQELSTLEKLKSLLSGTLNRHPHCFLSISQRHSWGPLQITEPMLRFLSKSCNLGSSIWDLASCFYTRNSEIESTFCIPFTAVQDGPITEVSYTVRYPELKPVKNSWVIRQTGVYQRMNTVTGESMSILFNPMPTSKLEQKLDLLAKHASRQVKVDSFWLHKELFQVYIPAWRSYIAYLEGTLLPIANHAIVTFIEELSDTEYQHLTELAFLESRLIQIPVILKATQDVLGELAKLCDEKLRANGIAKTAQTATFSCQFEQHHRNCQAYIRVTQSLQERAQRITQLLGNTLSFREQLNAMSQNESMLKLNKSAVFITTLTLLYLPPSFVATFFGMNFFELNKETGEIVSTTMIWIFVLCSALLTTGTFLLYHLLLRGSLLNHLGKMILNIKKITFCPGLEKNVEHELGPV